MSGGIQNGTTAFDDKSLKMDKMCRKVRDLLERDLKINGLVCKKKLDSSDIPGNIGACQPDIGAWFYNGKLIVVGEGKKQQDKGNAIERWFKNNYICRLINPEVSYLTFACGSGAHINGQIGKTLHVAHLDGGIDKYIPGKNSLFMSIEQISEQEMYEIVKNVIEERILNEDS